MKQATESCKGYTITVSARRLDDGTFTDDQGMIYKPSPVGTGLPIEISFKSGQRHPTEDGALKAGIAFAKKKIADGW